MNCHAHVLGSFMFDLFIVDSRPKNDLRSGFEISSPHCLIITISFSGDLSSYDLLRVSSVYPGSHQTQWWIGVETKETPSPGGETQLL